MATTLIVTGASRGIGRAIAIAFARSFGSFEASDQRDEDADIAGASTHSTSLVTALVARSENDLEQTAKIMLDVASSIDELAVVTSCHALDLSDLDGLDAALDGIFEALAVAEGTTKIRRAILINNAGSLGPLGPTPSISSLSSLSDFRSAVDFNITSSSWVSSRFVQQYVLRAEEVVVVNVSSLCAIEPFKTMATYCMGKAARDMFHSVLAKENEECNSQKDQATMKVLNYAPGPVLTSMHDTLAGCTQLDGGLREFYTSSVKNKDCCVDVNDTAQRLVDLICKNEFESGSHVDYYDLDGN